MQYSYDIVNKLYSMIKASSKNNIRIQMHQSEKSSLQKIQQLSESSKRKLNQLHKNIKILPLPYNNKKLIQSKNLNLMASSEITCQLSLQRLKYKHSKIYENKYPFHIEKSQVYLPKRFDSSHTNSCKLKILNKKSVINLIGIQKRLNELKLPEILKQNKLQQASTICYNDFIKSTLKVSSKNININQSEQFCREKIRIYRYAEPNKIRTLYQSQKNSNAKSNYLSVNGSQKQSQAHINAENENKNSLQLSACIQINQKPISNSVKSMAFSSERKQNSYVQTSERSQKKIKKLKIKKLIMKSKQQYLKQLSIYEKKISTYRDFVFLVNYAHNRFDPIILKQQFNINRNEQKYRAYIGKGNNYLLIRSLIKRRFWWNIQEQHKSANFVWTQLKLLTCFRQQSTRQQQLVPQNVGFIKSETLNKQLLALKNISLKIVKPDPKDSLHKILNKRDRQSYQKFLKLPIEHFSLEDFELRNKFSFKSLAPVSGDCKTTLKMHNHLECNFHLGNKKALFYNLRQYYQLIHKPIFQHIPLTFHIKKGLEDKQYLNFVRYFKKKEQLIKKQQLRNEDLPKRNRKKIHNIWIVKPGQNSNRGNGITVIDQLYELNNILKKKQIISGSNKTYIVQSYIDRPLLYYKRKFDIRHYMLITTLYGKMKGYWYSQGYIRTSSMEFNMDDLGDPMIHLTNDAIQKNGINYGKFEQGNKISYTELQRYLDQLGTNHNFEQQILPKMKIVARDSIKSVFVKIDPSKLQSNFEIFGLDFMIDEDFNLWLIEINTNPCLQISSGLLGRIIPTMVEHSLRLSLDIIFPPPAHYPNNQKYLVPDNCLENLKFELIFDEQQDGAILNNLYLEKPVLDYGSLQQQEQIYENDGREYSIETFL